MNCKDDVEEKFIRDWNEGKVKRVSDGKIMSEQMRQGNLFPYTITFMKNEKQIGVLDFNGPHMIFSGDAEESAKVFFEVTSELFEDRMKKERIDERKKCVEICEKEMEWGEINRSMAIAAGNCAEAIRARGDND